jgi:hypothetical protein
MAVSVAPLTTVVMTSIEQNRAGTASGINNAVARVAGVLAVAILGVVMVGAFGHRLQREIDRLDLSAGIRQEIQSGVIKLGALEVPSGLDTNTSNTIRDVIAESFVFGFRLIMAICAGLAAASAVVTLKMIPSRVTYASDEPSLNR